MYRCRYSKDVYKICIQDGPVGGKSYSESVRDNAPWFELSRWDDKDTERNLRLKNDPPITVAIWHPVDISMLVWEAV